MAKRYHKVLSGLLAALMATSAASVAASAATVDSNESGAGTLSKYYSTNAKGVGAKKTISVDGDFSDWDSSMLIAQGAANDDPRVYRDASMHENPIDLYALYGAYDDSNLYLMWEMTNAQDCVADPNDNYPLSQGVLWKTEELPFFIAIDTGKSDAIGNNGNLQKGGTIWGSGMSITSSFNRLISINTKGGNGPFVYGGDSTGLNAVEMLGPKSTLSNIKMNFGLGILSKEVWGIDAAYGPGNGRVPGDLCNESSKWVDFNTKGHNSKELDFFYELSIPLDELGITASDVESTGVGVLLVATYGKSGMDCLPYDLTMNDNAAEPDTQSQPGNSFEKSDEDTITTSFARIGNGTVPPRPSDTDKPTESDTSTAEDTTSDTTTEVTTDSTTDTEIDVGKGEFTVNATAKSGDTVDVTLSVGGHKDLFGISNTFTFDTAKYQFVSAEGIAKGVQINDGGAPNGQINWNMQCGDGSGGEDYSTAKEVIKLTFKAIADADGVVGTNKVRDCYDYDFKSLSRDCIDGNAKVTSNTTSDTATDTSTDTSTETTTDTTTDSEPKTDTEAKTDTEPKTDSEKENPDVNIPVTADEGDTVTVTFKAKGAVNALGLEEVVDYDTTALEYVTQTGGMGHIEVSTNYSNRLVWSTMFDAKGTNLTNEADVCILEFKAKKKLSADDKILSYKVVDFYDVNDNDFDAVSTTSAVAEASKSEPVPDKKVIKIPVEAKNGDKVTVYFKAKDAAKALGIMETVKYDNLALQLSAQAEQDEMGHSEYNIIDADTIKWSLMFDANGVDIKEETDVFYLRFTAARDITSDEDVLSYVVDEFYDVTYEEFEAEAHTRGVAVVESKDSDSATDTNTATDENTDTSSTTDTTTDSTADSTTDTNTETTTDTATGTDTATDTNTETSTNTEQNTDTTSTNTEQNTDTTSTNTEQNTDTTSTNTEQNTDTTSTNTEEQNTDTTSTNTEQNTDTTSTNTESDTDTASDSSTDTQTDEGETVIMGDVNDDKKVSAKDSLLIQRVTIKLVTFTDKQTFVGDVDQDKKISGKDALNILRYSIHVNTNTVTGEERVYKP